MSTVRRLATLAAGLALVGTAGAQTVYRCGPDGRTYSQQPCVDGRPIDAGDARTREQQAQTQAAAKRDARAAAALEQDRRRAEARAGAKAASLSAPPPAPAASKPAAHKAKSKAKGKRPADAGEDFRAVAPVRPTPAGDR